MMIIIAGALILGLAIGFIIAWAIGVGSSTGLITGFVLVVAGGIVGFVAEWFIDEAYRRNRELQRQLSEQTGSESQPIRVSVGGQNDGAASQALADALRQRELEAQQFRQQIGTADAQIDELRRNFEAYQQTHPDDLTVIKGIGPVFQRKLRDIGFNSYDQLARADPDRLRRMLDIKNWQRVDVEGWIKHAQDWIQRSQ